MLPGISMTELLIILGILLLLFGSHKVSQMARSLGRGLGEVRRAKEEIKEEIGINQLQEARKELEEQIGVGQLRRVKEEMLDEVKQTVGRLTDDENRLSHKDTKSQR